MAEGVGNAVCVAPRGGRRSMSSILLIEDDVSLRELLHTTLTTAGYDVVDAANGRLGLKAFRKSPTDLVITDLYMPERDGLEVIEALRRAHRNVKVLAISGASGTMGYFPLAQALGAVAVLQKPFSPSVLLKAGRGAAQPCWLRTGASRFQ